jgi:phenylpropionate dioxygenase-like ring-hydroxylating dioxygenase large terminal subunit
MTKKNVAALLGGSAYPTANRRMDSPVAPFIYNAWYVLAERAEVGTELRQRRVLGLPICFYRAEDGQPVALDDRCAHRRFPLSKGQRIGDEIQCGYHGFTFDRTGACVRVPGMAKPGRVAVRSYPIVERGPYVWIWTGDPELPDPDSIPFLWEECPEEPTADYVRSGYALNPCNYLIVHENLLDLTHLFFLHGAASEEYAVTPPSDLDPSSLFPQLAARAAAWEKTAPMEAGFVAAFLGEDPAHPVVRTDRVVSVAPSLNVAVLSCTESDGVTPWGPERFYVSHCLTPETETSTHQFWSFKSEEGNPIVLSPDTVAVMTHEIFSQDLEAVTYQMEMIETDESETFVEHSVRADRPGLRLRAILSDLVAAER